MSTATITYQVSANQISQIKSAVLDIIYIDLNGVTQRIPGYSSPTGSWSLTFTGTQGNQYGCSAVEIQGGNGQQSTGQGVQVVMTNSHGSVTTTVDNYTNTKIRAGAELTI
jgi:hypothetical protein